MASWLWSKVSSADPAALAATALAAGAVAALVTRALSAAPAGSPSASSSSAAAPAAPPPGPAPGKDAAFFGTREGFLTVYDEIVAFLTDEVVPSYRLPAEAQAHTRALIDYNVPGGKLNRGLTVVQAVNEIRGEERRKAGGAAAAGAGAGAGASPAEAKRAAVLGWCIEWLQAFFLVADDIMDASLTRRGQPCWYKKPEVGMVAINDGFLLQSHLFLTLRRYFAPSAGGDAATYLQLIELFNETTWQTELGQMLDLTSQPQPGSGLPIDLDRFTLQRYRAIVEYKTAYYSFYLPVACALVLSGHASPAKLAASKEILLVMGEYFQVQDDYLDCYADAETLGKVGTDIQDNKCGWLVVQALKLASPAQKALLKRDYGVHDAAAVERVKALYRELDLKAVFERYEAESYAQLQALIRTKCDSVGLPRDVFNGLLGKIYKRSK